VHVELEDQKYFLKFYNLTFECLQIRNNLGLNSVFSGCGKIVQNQKDVLHSSNSRVDTVSCNYFLLMLEPQSRVFSLIFPSFCVSESLRKTLCKTCCEVIDITIFFLIFSTKQLVKVSPSISFYQMFSAREAIAFSRFFSVTKDHSHIKRSKAIVVDLMFHVCALVMQC